MTYKTLTVDQLGMVLGTLRQSFKNNVAHMHDIYKLPKSSRPSLDALNEEPIERLAKFQKTLTEELSEFGTPDNGKPSIKQKLELLGQHDSEALRQECLTDIADWLADIVIYCRSEAMKFGIPLEEVIDVVMGSNFTKVGASPTYDTNGKVQKDLTHFIPPENAINTILFGVADE